MKTDLSSIRAMTFDCYGTLIDWERGILDVLQPWAQRHSLQLTDDNLLAAYADVEHVCQIEHPRALYTDILRAVQSRLAERFKITPSSADANALAASVGDWPPFPDTPAALARLKTRYKLVILSNIDNESFRLTNKKLGVVFDAIITAQDVGTYKPAQGHFLRGIEVLRGMGIEKSQILHVAQSLFHDHVPAKELGLTTAWVNRRHDKTGDGATPRPSNDVKPDYTVNTLAELADLCRV